MQLQVCSRQDTSRTEAAGRLITDVISMLCAYIGCVLCVIKFDAIKTIAIKTIEILRRFQSDCCKFLTKLTCGCASELHPFRRVTIPQGGADKRETRAENQSDR